MNPFSWWLDFVPPEGLSSSPIAFAKSMFAAPPTRPTFRRKAIALLSPFSFDDDDPSPSLAAPTPRTHRDRGLRRLSTSREVPTDAGTGGTGGDRKAAPDPALDARRRRSRADILH